jgi:hypothetical protein
MEGPLATEGELHDYLLSAALGHGLDSTAEHA